jgi:hypothetical protein
MISRATRSGFEMFGIPDLEPALKPSTNTSKENSNSAWAFTFHASENPLINPQKWEVRLLVCLFMGKVLTMTKCQKPPFGSIRK